MTTDFSTELIKLIQEQVSDLINANGSILAQKLLEAESGEITVSYSQKMSLVTGRLYATTNFSTQTKVKDSVTGSVQVFDPDPSQVKMEIITKKEALLGSR